MKQENKANEELSDDESYNPGESTLLSDIEEDSLDQHHQVLLLGQMRQDESLRTTMVPLP